MAALFVIRRLEERPVSRAVWVLPVFCGVRRCLGGPDDPVAALLLSLVERAVGAGDQVLGGIGGHGRDAKRGRYLRPVRICQGFNAEADVFGLVCSHIDIAVGQKNDQLFAAVAARDIGFAQVASDCCRAVAQYGIALGVPILVVQTFEVIEVDHDHGEIAVLTLGQANEAVDGIFHVPPVVKAGQGVAQRLATQFFAKGYVGESQRHGISKCSAQASDRLQTFLSFVTLGVDLQ